MRTITNDILAVRAKERARAAKPDSREQRAWGTVARCLDATTTIDSARMAVRALSIPTLRDDALRLLEELVYEGSKA
jgi:hypothetical protein